MDVRELQGRLAASGRYSGAIDGMYGTQTRAGVLAAMTDGPDTKLQPKDIAACAQRLEVEGAAIDAFASVETAGSGFSEGRPTILFEGPVFSRLTGHKFDGSYGSVSWPKFDRTRYPASQAQRWSQLVYAAGLDIDAAFSSASYGRFQIMGENFKACGFNTPFDFAERMAQDEVGQLLAFERFITSSGLVPALKARDWDALARGYNGPSYKLNNYADKLASAYLEASRHAA